MSGPKIRSPNFLSSVEYCNRSLMRSILHFLRQHLPFAYVRGNVVRVATAVARTFSGHDLRATNGRHRQAHHRHATMETLQPSGVRCRLRGGRGTRRCCLKATRREGETARQTLVATVHINIVPLPAGLAPPCGLYNPGGGISLPFRPAPGVGWRVRDVRVYSMFKDVAINLASTSQGCIHSCFN